MGGVREHEPLKGGVPACTQTHVSWLVAAAGDPNPRPTSVPAHPRTLAESLPLTWEEWTKLSEFCSLIP